MQRNPSRNAEQQVLEAPTNNQKDRWNYGEILPALLARKSRGGLDRLQLQSVMEVCRRSRSIADAGGALFGASRTKRSTINDSDHLRKFLQRFELNWDALSST